MIIIFPPIFGAGLGWFLPVIAEWLLTLSFIPGMFLFPLELIVSWNSVRLTIIAGVIGMIAGIFFSQFIFSEILKATISDEEIKLLFKNKEETIKKKDIFAVYMEDQQIVILDFDGNERYRERLESKKTFVQEVLYSHNYPWTEEDPFKDQYQRWVTGHPDYPANINTLLAAREQAMKKEEEEEAKVLRKDLAQLGVVIRDEMERQYVRKIGRRNDG